MILKEISIQNFKIFRQRVTLPLSASNYLVGGNNSGKTSVLNAIRFFFDSQLYESRDFLNQAEFGRRQTGFNLSEIAITFNLKNIRKVRLKDALIKKYGAEVTISKKARQTDLGALSFGYVVANNAELPLTQCEPEIVELIQSIKINYIHPQRGAELLTEAQSKLKKRLLENFGRGARGMTQEIREIEKQWLAFNKTSTEYLSNSLQAYVEKVWPDSQISVSLPKDIKQILEISDIKFSAYKGAPPIDLLNQGAGAQSTILYFAHYVLDVDRTPYRNSEYHPVWLLEEPESFLHADLISKFGAELNSPKWVENIPLIVSTHSSILLSRSRVIAGEATWHHMAASERPLSKASDKWQPDEVGELGKAMGDNNFKYYFEASALDTGLYVEDERESTIEGYIRSGIKVSKSFKGMSKFKNMIMALIALDQDALMTKKIALVDNDKGLGEIKHLLEENPFRIQEHFQLFKVRDLPGAYVIVLPEGQSAENLYGELESELDIVANEILEPDLSLKAAVPARYSGLVSMVRKKLPETNRDVLLEIIKSNIEFKGYFWDQVDKRKYKLMDTASNSIKELIRAAMEEDNQAS